MQKGHAAADEWEELCKSNFHSPSKASIMPARDQWIQKGSFKSRKFFPNRQHQGRDIFNSLGFKSTSSCGIAAAPDHRSRVSGSSKEASSNGVRPLRLALAVLLIWFIIVTTWALVSIVKGRPFGRGRVKIFSHFSLQALA